MTLERRFQVYLVLIHLVFAASAVAFLADHRIWLLAVELFFAVSFVYGLRLVRSFAAPANLLRHASRSLVESDFTTRLRPAGRPEMDELIDVYNRMVDHLRQERTFNQEQELFLQKILEASPLGVITLDLDGRIAAVNPGAVSLLGLPATAVVGRSVGELDTPFTRALQELAPGETQVLPLRGPRRIRCRKLSFIDRGFAKYFLLVEEMTEELRLSEKAAYDRLIRIMSHEVNNTSGAVSSLLDSCRNYQAQIDEDHRTDFVTALDVATSRLSQMNSFMKQFADIVRLPPPRCRPESVRALLDRIERLMSPEFKRRDITWIHAGEADIPAVSLDAAQMEQALLNIVKNAMESIGTGGTITARLTASGPRGALVIADSGPGIPADVRDQIFTPFFTTKEYGQGIGLTLVREILIGHGFDFSLENGAAGGAEFTVMFPAG